MDKTIGVWRSCNARWNGLRLNFLETMIRLILNSLQPDHIEGHFLSSFLLNPATQGFFHCM